MSKGLPKWDEGREATLVSLVGVEDGSQISSSEVEVAADKLETSVRSVSSKLRRMGYAVESSAKARTKAFSESEELEIQTFVETNSGQYTYAEIAAAVLEGKHTAKAVQGKLLSMELTSHVKPTPKQEAVKKYTDGEEAVFIKMAEAGSFLEDIAEKLGKPLNSIRGKALSLNRQRGMEIPPQKHKVSTDKADAMSGLDVPALTVAEIAEKLEKSERGVKTMLTHRGLVAKDYDGSKRAAKIAEKKED